MPCVESSKRHWKNRQMLNALWKMQVLLKCLWLQMHVQCDDIQLLLLKVECTYFKTLWTKCIGQMNDMILLYVLGFLNTYNKEAVASFLHYKLINRPMKLAWVTWYITVNVKSSLFCIIDTSDYVVSTGQLEKFAIRYFNNNLKWTNMNADCIFCDGLRVC